MLRTQLLDTSSRSTSEKSVNEAIFLKPCQIIYRSARFQFNCKIYFRTMEYGLGGNMRVNVVEEQLHPDCAIKSGQRTDIDDPKISLLELEIEDIALELEKEKKKSSAERAECIIHLAELEDAERELFRCHTDLQRSQQNLAEARDNNKELVDAEKELMWCRQRIEELEQQIEQMAVQIHQEGISGARQTSLTDLCQYVAQSHRTRRDGSASELVKPLEERGSHNLTAQVETPSPAQMNQVLQENLEEQTKLTLQIKTLENRLQTLDGDLKTSQAETDHKRKEIDVLRSYFRGSEQKKLKKEGDIREKETEMEKDLKMKDSMIHRFTLQVEELQIKAKRIPQLASQLSRLETLNAKLESSFKQKEKELGDRNTKLKSTLNAFAAKNEREFAELKASKEALKQDNNRTNKRAVELEKKHSKLEQVIKVSEESNKALKDEKKILEQRILQLEKVREEKRSTFGIVFSVDLSGSLMGQSQLLAKDAFRTLVNDLRSKFPKVHVGVVVHGPSAYIARQMAEVDYYTSSILDSIACEGSEDYVTAFTHVVSLLSTFKYLQPGAKRRVIMISDGQGYSTLTDVSTLCADRIPCHNIVVGSNICYYPSSTQECSSATGGGNFGYNGNFGNGDVTFLTEP